VVSKSQHACPSLDALVCGYSSLNQERKVLIMLQGFADESEGRILSLTGCISTYPQWDLVSNDWAAALAESPSIEYFHMREARDLSGQFEGFDVTKRDLKIVRLVSVALAHKPDVLTTWMMADDYTSIVGSVSPYETHTGYLPCFYALLFRGAAYSRDHNLKLPIDFVFDEKGKIGTYALNWYDAVKSAADATLKPFFGATPIFRDDMQIVPLQVADLIGWHVHRKLESPGYDIERIATERLDELWQKDVHLDTPYLMELAAQFSEVFDQNPLAFLVREKPSKRRKIIGKLKKQLKRRLEKL